MHLLFTHRFFPREAPAFFRPWALSSFRRWFGATRPSLPLLALFILGAVSAFAQSTGGTGSLDLSSITNFFTSIAVAYRGWVILAIILLGLAGLVMMIQSRTRTVGLGMAVVALVAGIGVGIVTKHVNDNTGSSINLQ